jgi:formylmethanofuran dehydrogenase subunit B
LEVIPNVVCPFCGCCCDDIEVTIANGKITGVKNACAIGMTKFLHYSDERNSTPMVRKNGELFKTTLDMAIEKTVEILTNAKYPILYGWSSTSCEAQKVGVELAEEVGGVLDNTSSVCHGPSIEAVQDIGESTCTFGEVKHRADLVVYWGCNPVQAHMRHMVRYSASCVGKFRKGRADRTIVVVDVRNSSTAKLADYFIQIEPNQDYEFISALRMAIRMEEIEQDSVAGVPVEKIEELADILIGCQFGIIFFGLGLTMSAGKNRNIDAALSLVRDLNSRTKFLIMPMRGHFNVTGANKVSAWQTGYPFAVDFSQGYPRYNPGDTSVIDILNRGECDAALIVASDPVAHFPQQAIETLSRIPVAIIDPHLNATSLLAEVVIPSAFVGIEAEGIVYRMDGVPLILKKLVDPPNGIQSDEAILRMILTQIRKQRGD